MSLRQVSVSAVIPTHQRPKLLLRAIQSVLGQSHTDLEVIVVIDGAELRSSLVRATFGDRVLNGDHKFGLMVSEPKVEYDGQSFKSLFCRKW